MSDNNNIITVKIQQPLIDSVTNYGTREDIIEQMKIKISAALSAIPQIVEREVGNTLALPANDSAGECYEDTLLKNNVRSIANTLEAVKHYFRGKGESVQLDKKLVQSLMNTEKFKEKHEKIISGKTEEDNGFFSVNMTKTKNAFFIGRTMVDYRVETSVDGRTSTVIYTLFVRDGFWDVDFIDEKILGGILGMESQKPDGKGPNLERLGGTPYDFIPETIQITFPTPNYDPKYDIRIDNIN
jgi:hypothetical protein